MTASPADPNHTPRVEDDALVRGAGRFMDDPRLPNAAFAAFVRSPHAHARVVSVKTDDARRAKKVLAVLTAEDMKAANVGSVSRHPPVPGRGGAKMIMPFRPSLAGEKVMHVGDPVAMVVAETIGAAQDAADLVQVEYEELPAVIDLHDAMKKDGTQLYAEAPGNLCVDWPGPVPDENNERDVADAITKAPHVAKVSDVNQRMVVASMETRGSTGIYDKANDSYTLYVCSQSADSLRNLTAGVMGLPPEKLRVITEDVGGAFGMKTPPYPEYPALLVASRQLGRPVHWQSTRSEAFLTDTQARDTVTEAELALDEKGKFLALRVRHLCNQGAYVSTAGVGINTNNFARCLPGMYRIPKVDVSVACYFSNTVPIGPYRGAGRPEANYALERVVEEAARITGIDPVRLRKKNLIPPSAMPFKTPINTYDSGDFPAIVDRALELADFENFNKRRRESSKRKRLRGIGVSCMLEQCRWSRPPFRFLAATSSFLAAMYSRPARATPPFFRVCSPTNSASMPPRFSTVTVTPRWESPVSPPSVRAPRCVPAVRSCTRQMSCWRRAGKWRQHFWKLPRPISSIAMEISKSSAPTARSRCSIPRDARKRLAKVSTPRKRPRRR